MMPTLPPVPCSLALSAPVMPAEACLKQYSGKKLVRMYAHLAYPLFGR
jgi:hypothetical protein